MTRKMAERKIKAYFDSKNITLWSRAFDIQQEGSRIQAEEFLLKVLTDLGFIDGPVDTVQ